MGLLIQKIPSALLTDVRQVTVFWVGRLGDFLLATPFLRSLRIRFPRARIRMVVGDKGLEIAQMCPDIDEIRTVRSVLHPFANLRLAWNLRFKPADLLIDLNPSYSRVSTVLGLCAAAKTKLCFEKPGSFAFTHQIAEAGVNEHMLDRYGRLAQVLNMAYEPTLRVRLSDEDRGIGKKIMAASLRLLKLPETKENRLWIGIHPGNFKKFDNRWPEENFVELAGRLLQLPNIQLFFLSGPGEEKQVRAIAEKLPQKAPVLPPFSLRETAGILSCLNLLIVNATGTAHLAAALQVPTFTFLSRYTKTLWMPRSGPHFSVVSGEWESCRNIPVEEAWKALQHALKHFSPAGKT